MKYMPKKKLKPKIPKLLEYYYLNRLITLTLDRIHAQKN